MTVSVFDFNAGVKHTYLKNFCLTGMKKLGRWKNIL